MKKDWKYIVYLSLAFGLFVLVKLSGSKQFNWVPTYSAADKNPFGGFVLHELLPSLFSPHEVKISNRTVYELKDSLKNEENILILTSRFQGDREDANALLSIVNSGANILISAQDFRGTFADTLKLETKDNYFQATDSAYLLFTGSFHDTTKYFFRRENVHNYFSRLDTSRTTIITANMLGQPVTIRTRYGKGSFILNSTPLAFTNIYLVDGNHHQFVSGTFSYLPNKPLHWSEYYSVGRGESMTPLRFILTEEPLAWAYYLSVVSLLLFMAFESKRRQRIIPIVKPLENTSLEFARTIGNLYYTTGDHRNIAEKKILFFFEQARSRYGVSPGDQSFISTLARKSGHAEETIRSLADLITQIRSKHSISSVELIVLNEKLENFNHDK